MKAPRRHPAGLFALVAALIGVVCVVVVIVRSQGDDGPQAVAVASSGATYADLDGLLAASDLVVIGKAVSVSDGREFADPDATAGVRSQVVELQIGAVLAGPDPGGSVLMEEEATIDGRPIMVDGLRPTRLGDEGIFFLVAVAGTDTPYFVTASTAGRLLRRSDDRGDDRLHGATTPLGRTLSAMGGEALADAIVAGAASINPVDPAAPTTVGPTTTAAP